MVIIRCIFDQRFIKPIFSIGTKVPKQDMIDYISPKKPLLNLDFMTRSSSNMNKITLDLEDEDIQWLFSPIHIREIFDKYV